MLKPAPGHVLYNYSQAMATNINPDGSIDVTNSTTAGCAFGGVSFQINS